MNTLAVVATHPIQYQAPLYRYLAQDGIAVKVFFLTHQGAVDYYDSGFGRTVKWDLPLLDGYPHEFLRNLRRQPQAGTFCGSLNPSIPRKLSADFSAVVVHGHRSLGMMLAASTAKLRHIPVFYRSDRNQVASRRLQMTAGPLFRQAVCACLTVGSLNDRFYASLGMPPARRVLVPHVVDNERFRRASYSVSKEEARRSLGIESQGPVVTFAGKLVTWKQPDLLLRAFASAGGAEAHLLMVGDGPMRNDLERWADRHLPGRVTFTGFLNQTEIPRAYRCADLLVLPSSTEAWGLVVNEVMNFAVPVLVSDRVGCAPDLVIPGKTGQIFRSGDEASLSGALEELLRHPGCLSEMGSQARAHIASWDLARAAAGVRLALDRFARKSQG